MTVDPAELARFNAGTARGRAAYIGRDAQLEAEQRRTEALMDAWVRRQARREALAARVTALQQHQP